MGSARRVAGHKRDATTHGQAIGHRRSETYIHNRNIAIWNDGFTCWLLSILIKFTANIVAYIAYDIFSHIPRTGCSDVTGDGNGHDNVRIL